VPTPVVPAPVAPPTKPVVQAPAPAPPAPVAPPEVDTGIAPYGTGARTLIRSQIHISALIKRLGLEGTVKISFKVAPTGGAAYDIAIVGGSDNPLIRKAALESIKATTFPPYTHDMPQRPLKFTVPIKITAE
jgi:protein TonB